MYRQYILTALSTEGLVAAFIALVVFLSLLPTILQVIQRRWRLRKRRKKYLGASLEEIDRMDGYDFEDYLESLFHALGYKTIETPKSGDYGVDLILETRSNKERICIQAKRYKGSVGISAVQEIFSGNAYYDGDRAIVVTNSRFTNAARTLAQKIGVELVGRAELQKLMRQASSANKR